ncbi:hypothetical protein DSO57_1034206 [Entomophthora muscae]|uniref:Uncharacterized protein n=1 Tax=Entomophthora muscae TaxID=34485 RepID=A0ACC2S215_9FUNG|nr:hypothetical protein DSO57_1034206 [Entomophthora muscae]
MGLVDKAGMAAQHNTDMHSKGRALPILHVHLQEVLGGFSCPLTRSEASKYVEQFRPLGVKVVAICCDIPGVSLVTGESSREDKLYLNPSRFISKQGPAMAVGATIKKELQVHQKVRLVNSRAKVALVAWNQRHAIKALVSSLINQPILARVGLKK